MSSINNLGNIISQDGLICKKEIAKNNVQYENIANCDVQDKRAQTIVPFPPGGNLHCYVPFYFWGLTPMLLVNQHRQNDIIFFVTQTEIIVKAKLPFAFTDRHAVVSYAQFYNDPEKLNSLDWQTIKLKYWADTPDAPDRKEKKQAEFLIHEKLPWAQIYGIAVNNQDVLERVESRLNGLQHKPIIKVKKEWHYLHDTYKIW
jgi:hypothetical protein